jgi:hypothetical protein
VVLIPQALVLEGNHAEDFLGKFLLFLLLYLENKIYIHTHIHAVINLKYMKPVSTFI